MILNSETTRNGATLFLYAPQLFWRDNMRNIFYSLFIIFVSINAGFSQSDTSSAHKEGQLSHIRGLGALSNTESVSKDPLLPEMVQHIRKRYGVHTVILFGSRARGTGTAKSDYDIIGLQKSGEKKHQQDSFKGAYLDIFICPQSAGAAVVDNLQTAWQEAIVLYQPHHEGEQFIQALKKAFADPQTNIQTKNNDIRLLITNLGRGQENDIREHFYRRKFLMLALEKYFPIHNLTSMGPRKNLEWLKKYHPLTYAAFEKALSPNASTETLYELLAQIGGPNVSLDLKALASHNTIKQSPKKEKYVFTKDPLLPAIVRHIKDTYGGHTVILYGSRAQGTATLKSDYDIIVLQGSGIPAKNVRDLFQGVALDLHLLPDETVKDKYVSGYLSIVEGAAVLTQKENLGDRFIQNIQEVYNRGFFTSDTIKQRIIDEIKMHLSKVENTTVGYYYQNLVLSNLLEHYFTLRNIFYIGSRESFRWIKKNDLTTYELFEQAVKPGANLASTKALVERVIVGTIYENK